MKLELQWTVIEFNLYFHALCVISYTTRVQVKQKHVESEHTILFLNPILEKYFEVIILYLQTLCQILNWCKSIIYCSLGQSCNTV